MRIQLVLQVVARAVEKIVESFVTFEIMKTNAARPAVLVIGNREDIAVNDAGLPQGPANVIVEPGITIASNIRRYEECDFIDRSGMACHRLFGFFLRSFLARDLFI